MNKSALISYAMDFASFLLGSGLSERISSIILFGSVARGDFDKESDIDIFIDVKKYDKLLEEKVRKRFELFEKSEMKRKWELKGVKNPLSLKIGELKKWKIGRSVLSDGIMLYGKYRELPENLKYYSLFKINFDKIPRSEQVSIWRKLYGYSQKVGKKTYTSKGLVEQCGGKKLERGIIIIPIENKEKIINFLKKRKINYTINEIWSDTL
ncbi:MAG: nucleotidyltransferase domain-containing protein [Candidatus Aenigmarchaeota archaeon]|nr:nucleotidyltransferase domain-containing protein [Candidatus Aenigmarchaeota archaeon]